ncbi:unnamed protein product [Spirodela intermedia]|uniref:Uncharacterized protein n=1 Tax=Spirodela intermedia TaxID=51605 RepID=A0A7I8IXU0_SPIIN|nr:unnamed protein product [Spirodela intermedia]CAA6662396.1 unnamed protein product [Spirodela intermedia]
MGGSAGQPGPQAGRKPGPASGSEAQSGSSREQGLERLGWIDRGTCAPLPFHVTGGQPAVGQGVVVHLSVLRWEQSLDG